MIIVVGALIALAVAVAIVVELIDEQGRRFEAELRDYQDDRR